MVSIHLSINDSIWCVWIWISQLAIFFHDTTKITKGEVMSQTEWTMFHDAMFSERSDGRDWNPESNYCKSFHWFGTARATFQPHQAIIGIGRLQNFYQRSPERVAHPGAAARANHPGSPRWMWNVCWFMGPHLKYIYIYIYIYICIQLFGYHTPTAYEIVSWCSSRTGAPSCMYIYIYMCVCV